jgi:hypothetical protein
MGGDVTVSSMPGAGSTFVLTLPACIEKPPTQSTAPAQRSAPSDSSSIVHLN